MEEVFEFSLVLVMVLVENVDEFDEKIICQVGGFFLLRVVLWFYGLIFYYLLDDSIVVLDFFIVLDFRV